MSQRWPSRIEGTIHARELSVGQGVVVEPGALIQGKTGPADRVVLGDFAYVGHGVKIMAPEFVIGDYTKLHAGSFGHGGKPLRIGSNGWIGGQVVLDSTGGLDIEDNVGIGSHSQLWTHIRFGDVVEGSRFLSERYMRIGEDAWFVGQCLVSPVTVERRSMAMLGSVVTSAMRENRIYAGVPARDVSDKLGFQFETRTVKEKRAALETIVEDFLRTRPQFRDDIAIVESTAELRGSRFTIDVSSRQYLQTYSDAEVEFLKANVPTVKFLPIGKARYVA